MVVDMLMRKEKREMFSSRMLKETIKLVEFGLVMLFSPTF